MTRVHSRTLTTVHYDIHGNLIRTQERRATRSLSGNEPGETTYDAIGRLVHRGGIAYSYDASRVIRSVTSERDAPRADLAVRWVLREVNPQYRSLSLEAHIQNQGDAPSGFARMEMLVNGHVRSDWGQQSLSPGEKAQANLGYSVTEADRERGHVTLTIRLHPDGPDRDPANNEDTLQHPWPSGGDLEARHVSVLSLGKDQLELFATVINVGDAPASPYRYSLRLLDFKTGRELFRADGREEERLAPSRYTCHKALFQLQVPPSTEMVSELVVFPEGPDATPDTNTLHSRPRMLTR
jgi:hypothetical protein